MRIHLLPRCTFLVVLVVLGCFFSIPSLKSKAELPISETLTSDLAKKTSDAQGDAEWLFHLFPSMDNCIPKKLYYDRELHQSFNGFFEKRGYKSPELDAESVTYKINETFLGYKGMKFTIPKNGGSPYWIVLVNAPTDKLADKIYKVTKKRISIQTDPNYHPVHGKAYLFKEGENTAFVCYVNEGDD